MFSAFSAWTGPDLTGKCPDFETLSEKSVNFHEEQFTGLLAQCWQKYSTEGLSAPDYAPGGLEAWKQMVSGSVHDPVQAVQNNPGSLNIPQPGTTPVQPGTGLFTQIFHILVQGGTPVAQAAINYQMQQAAANKQPIHVPTPIVHAATSGSGTMSPQTKQILWLAAGAVGVTVALMFLLRRKK